MVNNELLCKLTVLSARKYKKNKYIDNQIDSCYFTMVNSTKKTFLIKKNCLTCDSTTGEVLTTTNKIPITKHIELDL